MVLLAGESIARAIRDHQITASGSWPYGELIKELHRVAELVDRDFNLGVPTPVIAIDHLRHDVLANYRLGRSGIGARTTITFNASRLLQRSITDTHLTLIHELVHAHEEWRLGRSRGGWYHTVAWREKMAEIGVVADDHGYHREVLPRCITYLKSISTDFQVPVVQSDPPAKRRQMPKWVCACRSGNPARAVYLNARCSDCGHEYQKAIC